MLVTRPPSISEQVDAILRARIREGIYVPGDRLPSESELSLEFGVSRATIRNVLGMLAAEGLILRKQGDGTYLNRRIQEVNTHSGGLWEFSRLIESSGHQSTIQPQQTEKRPATSEEAEMLSLEAGEEVLVLKRLFRADGRPVILATNVVPAGFIHTDPARLDTRLQIREFLMRYCRRKIAYVITDVRSGLLDEDAARFLEGEPGNPLLVLRTFFYDSDNRPLAFGHSYYDDRVLRLRLVQAWG